MTKERYIIRYQRRCPRGRGGHKWVWTSMVDAYCHRCGKKRKGPPLYAPWREHSPILDEINEALRKEWTGAWDNRR